MKVRNIAQFKFMHLRNGNVISIEAGEEKDIPDDIAALWMPTKKIVKVDSGAKDAEIERLKAENEKLKAKAKAAPKKAKAKAEPKAEEKK
jgi:hypothetical protein